MADYKILQNIDLAQNEIKEVSKIANDREDGEDKGLLIQTGNDTSLAFNRKIEKTKTINSIKGTVKDGTSEDKKESILNLKPSEIIISHTKGDKTPTKSTIIVGLNTSTPASEHIEAVSPSIDIKTGKTADTDYTHPYISLKKDGSTIELQSNTVGIRSKGTTESSLTMDGGITGVSNDIHLKDSSENVSLHLNTDGTISESANTSITETVGTRSVLLNTEGIKIEDSTTSTNTPSIIEVNDNGIKASKTSTINNDDGSKDSYIDIQSNTIEEKSSNVTIKTPNKVTLTLDDNDSYSASLTSTGAIKFTSNVGDLNNESSTLYGLKVIESQANNIKLHTIGYKSTEETEYHPHIELQSTSNNDSILLEGKTIKISSKYKKPSEGEAPNKDDSITISGTTLDIGNTKTSINSENTIEIAGTESITEISKDITLKDSSENENVSLNLKTDGTISESASKSITAKTLDDKVSLILEKNEDSTHSITLKNVKEASPSKIEISDSSIKTSKGSSDVTINSDGITGRGGNVTIDTPNVIFSLKESEKSASLTSTEGTITLTSQGDATTEYGNNTITTEADTITIKAKGYTENTEATKYYPHLKLESKASTNSVSLEGKTIEISSEKDGSNTEDTITLSGSKLNVNSTTTEITSNTINIKKGTDNVLILNTSAPSITIPSSTETDINSTTIGLGDKGNNSTTTVDGSKFDVKTSETSITSTTTISGTTTIKSSPNSENTIEVKKEFTSITGSQADINPANINIGTVDSSKVTIGKDNTNNTTTLKSSTTEITSSTLNIESNKVDFTKTNQEIIFEGAGGSVTSKVPTYIKDTTFSVEKTTDSSEVFKVDTSSEETSTTINGKTATINSTTVEIGTGTTNGINIGRNATDITTLQSSTTNITSPTIKVGTDSPSTSVSIGKDSSAVNLTGKNNLSMTSGESESEVGATNLRFDNKIYSNNIKIRWDSTLNSLVFEKA